MLLRIEDAEVITARAERDVVILSERPGVTITWSRYEQGEEGPGLHVHREHTDAFYVLDGELTFAVGPGGEERVRVTAGGFVAVPPNVVHTYTNDSGTTVRWLNFHAPDQGFAEYMRGLRDGTAVPFDQFDPPPDGGRPASEVVITAPGEPVKCELLELRVAESDDAPDGAVAFPLADGRFVVAAY
jgi:quercetin dioxygenase-like cupin family protein